MTVAKEEQQELQPQDGNDGNSNNHTNGSGLDLLINMVKEKGFEIEQQNKDYGAGPIDLVMNIEIHSALPKIKCGFIVLRAEERGGGAKDWQDNEYSLRKIEEAAMRGMRSGMDKTYLVVDNEEIAKSVSGKIEWLASFGSIIRLDSISLGLYPEQKGPAIIKPSQERVPQGEKLRKEEMRKREEKFDEYNRPKGERAENESEEKKITREVMLDEHSRPKGQKKQTDDAVLL
ncbi:MAG: hypothetical protein ACJ71G_19690 [Nitrososphaeraceae archaeon]